MKKNEISLLRDVQLEEGELLVIKAGEKGSPVITCGAGCGLGCGAGCGSGCSGCQSDSPTNPDWQTTVSN